MLRITADVYQRAADRLNRLVDAERGNAMDDDLADDGRYWAAELLGAAEALRYRDAGVRE
jgi:hypothetical protein